MGHYDKWTVEAKENDLGPPAHSPIASARVQQPGAKFTQVVGMLEEVLGAIAQVFSTPANDLQSLATAAADSMTDFVAAVGRQKQGDS